MPEESMFQQLKTRAKSQKKCVVLPESDLEIILRAGEQLLREELGAPLLIGNPETIQKSCELYGIQHEGFLYFDHQNEANCAVLAQQYSALFTDLSEKSVLRKCKDPLNCGMFLVKTGRADCIAAGRAYTTGEVIIAAQNILSLEAGGSTISSIGIVNAPGFSGSEGNLLAIGDCAIQAWPDANDLADIAISSAKTVNALLGWEPRVAMLSYSTCGSAEDDSIDQINKAIAIAKSRMPSLKIDGEFQLDTAINPETAARKVKRASEVAGKANVLIFPNLHAGNIGVKLIQTFGSADAYGPILQGFAYPVCDFSRSAPLSEIMGNLLMLIVRAQKGSNTH